MPLHPQAKQLIDRAKAAALPPLHTLSVADARARMASAFISTGEREEVHQIEEHTIPTPNGGINARLYRPCSEVGIPAILFFHGGGWILNSIETHDSLCRSLANLTRAVVVSVDYRLAPESKYPAASDDAWDAAQWLALNALPLGIDVHRIAVAGDSSGATLATVVALRTRETDNLKLCAQLLAYPVTDHCEAGATSYATHASGYSLGRDTMRWFWSHYVNEAPVLNDPYLCPLQAKSLTEMPPTYLITAEFDPLHDEGEAYAHRLKEAGVPVQYECLQGHMHGFLMQTRFLDDAKDALTRAADFLRNLFAAKLKEQR